MPSESPNVPIVPDAAALLTSRAEALICDLAAFHDAHGRLPWASDSAVARHFRDVLAREENREAATALGEARHFDETVQDVEMVVGARVLVVGPEEDDVASNAAAATTAAVRMPAEETHVDASEKRIATTAAVEVETRQGASDAATKATPATAATMATEEKIHDDSGDAAAAAVKATHADETVVEPAATTDNDAGVIAVTPNALLDLPDPVLFRIALCLPLASLFAVDTLCTRCRGRGSTCDAQEAFQNIRAQLTQGGLSAAKKKRLKKKMKLKLSLAMKGETPARKASPAAGLTERLCLQLASSLGPGVAWWPLRRHGQSWVMWLRRARLRFCVGQQTQRLACGGDGKNCECAFVVAPGGKLFSCGWHRPDGAEDDDDELGINAHLGHGERGEVRSFKRIEFLAARCRVRQVSLSPVAGTHHDESGAIVDGEGYCRCLALSENGQVFSWGVDCLGHGDKKDRNLPKLVEALKDKVAVQVSAGVEHNLVLTESGDVFSFGAGSEGKLGYRGCSWEYQDLPKLVEALKGKKVLQVSAGNRHNLVLTKSGDVFSFGCGSFLQLGHGDRTNQSLPKLVEALKGKKVVQVSAGGYHSLVLTEGGDVFSFGRGYHGMLGHGDEEQQYLPKLVEALKGEKVVQVSAGDHHSLVLTENGDVFGFGMGRFGELNVHQFPIIESQCVPKLLDPHNEVLRRDVVQIEAGGNHSMVMLSDETVHAFGSFVGSDKSDPVFVREWTAEDAQRAEDAGHERGRQSTDEGSWQISQIPMRVF